MKGLKKEMSSKLKLEKKHKPVLFYFAMFTVFVVAIITVISMQVEITQKSAEFDDITENLIKVEAANDQLRRYTSDQYRMEYIEQIARDQLDYSFSDETVYYFVQK